MQKKKKNFSWIFILLLGIFTIVIGYYVAAAWQEGCNLMIWYNNFINIVMVNPFYNYYNQYTIKIVIFFLFVYGLFVLYYVAGKKDLMPGKEMGTAKFANIKKINKQLSNKDFSSKNPKNIVVYKKVYPKYWLYFKKKFRR